MTAYLLTPAQHAQLVDALEGTNSFVKLDEALEMLKAMKPAEPRQWSAGDGLLSCSRYRSEPNYVIPLYAMETKT